MKKMATRLLHLVIVVSVLLSAESRVSRDSSPAVVTKQQEHTFGTQQNDDSTQILVSKLSDLHNDTQMSQTLSSLLRRRTNTVVDIVENVEALCRGFEQNFLNYEFKSMRQFVDDSTSFTCHCDSNTVTLNGKMECFNQGDICMVQQLLPSSVVSGVNNHDEDDTGDINNHICGDVAVNVELAALPVQRASISSCATGFNHDDVTFCAYGDYCKDENNISGGDIMSGELCGCAATANGQICSHCEVCSDGTIDIDCSNVVPFASTYGSGGCPRQPGQSSRRVNGAGALITALPILAGSTGDDNVEIYCNILQNRLSQQISSMYGSDGDAFYDCQCEQMKLSSSNNISCSKTSCVGGSCGTSLVHISSTNALEAHSQSSKVNQLSSCFEHDGIEICVKADICGSVIAQSLCSCEVSIGGQTCNSCSICDNNGFTMDCSNTLIGFKSDSLSVAEQCVKKGIAAAPIFIANQATMNHTHNSNLVAVESSIAIPNDDTNEENNQVCSSFSDKFTSKSRAVEYDCECNIKSDTNSLGPHANCKSDVCIADKDSDRNLCGTSSVNLIVPQSDSPPTVSSCFEFSSGIDSDDNNAICVDVQTCSPLDSALSPELCSCTASVNGKTCYSCRICGEDNKGVDIDCSNALDGRRSATNGCFRRGSFVDTPLVLASGGNNNRVIVVDPEDDSSKTIVGDPSCIELENSLGGQISSIVSTGEFYDCGCVRGKEASSPLFVATNTSCAAEPCFTSGNQNSTSIGCGVSNVAFFSTTQTANNGNDYSTSSLSSCYKLNKFSGQNANEEFCITADFCQNSSNQINVTQRQVCSCAITINGEACNSCSICGNANSGVQFDCSNTAADITRELDGECLTDGVNAVPVILAKKFDIDHNINGENDDTEFNCPAIEKFFEGQTIEVTSETTSYDCTCPLDQVPLPNLSNSRSITCATTPGKACIKNNIGASTCGTSDVIVNFQDDSKIENDVSGIANNSAIKVSSCFMPLSTSSGIENEYCVEAQHCPHPTVVASIDDVHAVLSNHPYCSCEVKINGQKCNSCHVCANDAFSFDCSNHNVMSLPTNAADGIEGRITVTTENNTECFAIGVAAAPFLVAERHHTSLSEKEGKPITAPANAEIQDKDMSAPSNGEDEDGGNDGNVRENGTGGNSNGLAQISRVCQKLEATFLYHIGSGVSYECTCDGTMIGLDASIECISDTCVTTADDVAVCGSSKVNLSVTASLNVFPPVMETAFTSCFHTNDDGHHDYDICVSAKLCSSSNILSSSTEDIFVNNICSCTADINGESCTACSTCENNSGFNIDCANTGLGNKANTRCITGGIDAIPFTIAGNREFMSANADENSEINIVSGTENNKDNDVISSICSALETRFDDQIREAEAGLTYNCACKEDSLFFETKIDCDAKGCIGDGTCGDYSVGLDVKSEDPDPPSATMYSCFESYDGTYEYCVEAKMCSVVHIFSDDLCQCSVRVNGAECNSCTVCDEDGFDIDCTNIDDQLTSSGCHKEGIAALPFLLAGQNKGEEVIDGCIYNNDLVTSMCDSIQKHVVEEVGGGMTCMCSGCSDFESICTSDEEICIGDQCGMINVDYSRSLFEKSTCSKINGDEFCMSVETCPSSPDGLCCTATGNGELCNSCSICGTNEFAVDCTNINSEVTTNGCIAGSNVKGISDNIPPILISLFSYNFKPELENRADKSNKKAVHTVSNWSKGIVGSSPLDVDGGNRYLRRLEG